MKNQDKKQVGVVALQGDVEKHIAAVNAAGGVGFQVRLPADVDRADGLIIPGGESTTILKLMARFKVDDAVLAAHKTGKPIYGTCAGLISICRTIASDTQSREGQAPLQLLDVTVARNAFGRQLDSFETDLSLSVLQGDPFRAVFIRAPIISEVGKHVEVIAVHDGKIVCVREGSVLGTSFHPEMTDDYRVHEYFLSLFK